MDAIATREMMTWYTSPTSSAGGIGSSVFASEVQSAQSVRSVQSPQTSQSFAQILQDSFYQSTATDAENIATSSSLSKKEEVALGNMIMSGGLTQSLALPALGAKKSSNEGMLAQASETSINDDIVSTPDYFLEQEVIDVSASSGVQVNSTGNGLQVTLNSGAEILFSSSGSWRVSDTGNGISIVTQAETLTFDADGQLISREAGGDPLSGTDGVDIIYNKNTGEYGKIIDAKGGSDTIINHVSGATILGGDGNDTISSVLDVSVEGGAGDDIIVLRGTGFTSGDGAVSNAHVDAGDGHDSVTVNVVYSDTNVNIIGGAGDDNIVVQSGEGVFSLRGEVHGTNLTLDGGSGNDNLSLRGAQHSWVNMNLNGGAGDDTIASDADIRVAKSITVDGGLDHDNIDMKNISAGEDITVLGGGGDDTINMLDLSGKNVAIDGGDGDDVINIRSIYAENVNFSGGDGDDALWTSSLIATVGATVDGGDGEDSIMLDYMENATLTGGDGEDSIVVGIANNSTIEDSHGKDKIKLDYSLNSRIAESRAQVGYAYSGPVQWMQKNADGTLSIATKTVEGLDALGNPTHNIDPESVMTLGA